MFKNSKLPAEYCLWQNSRFKVQRFKIHFRLIGYRLPPLSRDALLRRDREVGDQKSDDRDQRLEHFFLEKPENR
jgi:hypothetical protein